MKILLMGAHVYFNLVSYRGLSLQPLTQWIGLAGSVAWLVACYCTGRCGPLFIISITALSILIYSYGYMEVCNLTVVAMV